ncbi:MAG TPA: rhodanese-like domain-containing protein [Candidatus Acidoferrales bacterium]|nr:rhodanese-like domain-containing protein [Candidatus Acidoferrales bacterium]
MNSDMFANLEIEPRDVKALLDNGEKLLFVDVRESWEHHLCKIEGSRLIPLGQLASNLPAFESAEDVVLFCHSGRRSLDAAAWLRSQGIVSARSMTGGIDRWSREIDPSVPRY